MDIFIAKSSRFWHNWDRQDRNAADENIADHNMEYRRIDWKGVRCMKLQANIQTEALLEASGIKKELYCQILSLARKYRVEKLILFGSRARGDWRAASDIDLAVSGGDFPRFALDIEEVADTLLKFDMVNLNGPVQEELLDQIWKEGIVVYEKI